MEHIKKQKFNWIYVLFLMAAALFVCFFSTSTSPLYAGYGSDSAIFQVIGKYWAEGVVPYTELFDHKGPYIFLVDAIGYGITGDKIGLVMVQILNLFITLVGIYKITLLFWTGKKAWLWTFLTLGFLTLCYEGGNLTEEYMLPFLAFCTYGQLRFLWKSEWKEKGHDYKWALLYGVTFSLSVLTRLTNAVGLCCGIFTILCILIREKKWKNIGGNIVAVLIGTIVTALPFILYFWSKEALYDMLLGTILQNIKAAEAVTTFWWSEPHSIVGWFHIIIAHLCSYGLIAAGIVAAVKKQKEQAAYYLFVGVCMTVYLVTRYAFYHYMMIAIPYLPLVAAVCTDIGKYKEKLQLLLAAFLGVIILYQTYTVYRDSWNAGKDEPAYATLLQEVPEDEKDGFVAYNVKTDIYLKYNLKPCYRYFHHQDAHASKNEELAAHIVEEYKSGKAKWILVMETEFENCIEDILDENYSKVKTKEKYALYRMR